MFKLAVIALACASLALFAEALPEHEPPKGRMPLDSASQGIDGQTRGAIPEVDMRGEDQIELGDKKMPFGDHQGAQPQLDDQNDLDRSFNETDTEDLEGQGRIDKYGSYGPNSDGPQTNYPREHGSRLSRNQQEQTFRLSQQQPPIRRTPDQTFIDFSGQF